MNAIIRTDIFGEAIVGYNNKFNQFDRKIAELMNKKLDGLWQDCKLLSFKPPFLNAIEQREKLPYRRIRLMVQLLGNDCPEEILVRWEIAKEWCFPKWGFNPALEYVIGGEDEE